ncbi:MAG: hypothetical protein QMD22_11475, partial [archaeon]|nr:hypothetical protein [archaeon]
MSAPRSVLALASASLVRVKVSHQPSTKSHVWFGNELCDAGRREVSGFNASECIEPRNLTTCRCGRYCSFSCRQYSHNRPECVFIEHPKAGTHTQDIIWRGYENPTGSKAVARYQMELIRTWESQCIPEGGYGVDKPINGKRLQMMHWQSDYLIVLMKQGNACGEKGVAAIHNVSGKHSVHSE